MTETHPAPTDVSPAAPRRGAGRRRIAALALAVAVAGGDLGAKAWAERALPGDPIPLGLLELRLAYNPGVAFSMGGNLPSWVVIAVTGVITAFVAIVGWRLAPKSWAAAGAAAFILGGAAANLIDRAGDGVVTDYLHTGWWPTFNMADVFIVTGGIAVAILAWRYPDEEPEKAESAA
ncbi:putative signal peptidase [Streptomyces zinciresistens K42]|uniref:Lipoprotein signal peptidase n=1 Tax=Streptomyces zinciresistens K42 TaxID=700597 RepID=G2G9U4_9ACTN|nr:signal peptidase II [Streptomyces zinciresistens]EGX59766.1 putative signal peptidase [Streptomyces zinciresistens K42]